MIDEYPVGQVLGFIGAGLLLVVPLWLLIAALALTVVAACLADMFGRHWGTQLYHAVRFLWATRHGPS